MNSQWTFIKHLILSIVITIITLFSDMISKLAILFVRLDLFNSFKHIFDKRQASSIAIIGGADGPTAIFSTMRFPIQILFNKYLILFIILLILYKPFKYILRKF